MNATNNQKINYLHVDKNQKPLPTAENLEQLLIAFLEIHADGSIHLNGKIIPVGDKELPRVKHNYNNLWILHLKNLATIHGLPHGAIDYLPIIDFNQFLVEAAA
jgi:hypothetical protein